jgi:FAD synthetase
MGVTGESATNYAVGSFEAQPVRQLGRILAEPDKSVRKQKFSELGIVDSGFISRLEKSFGHCKRGLLLYPGTGELTTSFNGGKDACVVLYLWLAAAEALTLTQDPSATRAEARRQPVIFFDSSDEFDEVRDFVSWVVASLGLEMRTLEGQSFRAGMQGLVNEGLRAVVMGQRRGDPWMKDVDVFSPSTEGWPVFMRINPIIDWGFGDVWQFLRKLGLPYCSLYNDGYTSLGSIGTTFRNPALRQPDGTYRAAYQLADDDLERDGRMSRQVTRDAEATAAPPDPPVLQVVPESAQGGYSQQQPARVYCSAGIIVVGDEILNGKVRDCNAHYLCGMLHSRGVSIAGIQMVPDDIYAIAEAVQKMVSTCDFVFTAGGLGPTHDDVTVAGVAAAFRCRLIKDEKFFTMLSGGADKEGKARWSNTACQKMASLPQGATVEWPCDGNPWPIVSMNNVYVFAGMPTAFKQMFERASSDGRFASSQRFACVALRLDAEESDILDFLQITVDTYPSVHIGSYPSTDDAPNDETCANNESTDGKRCRLTITFEAFDADIIEEARSHLAKALPKEMLIT